MLGGLKGDTNRDLEWQSAERREINVMLGCFFFQEKTKSHTHPQRQEAWRKTRRCSNKCLIVFDVSFDFLVMPRRVTSQRHRQGAAAAAARTPPQRHCTLKGFCRQRPASHLPGCAFQGCRGGLTNTAHQVGGPRGRGSERHHWINFSFSFFFISHFSGLLILLLATPQSSLKLVLNCARGGGVRHDRVPRCSGNCLNWNS